MADDAALWPFSLSVYARPGVAEACLALQARRGLDVNLLLWCGWRAAVGVGACNAAELREAMALT
ncbi:MAG: TIGR02444 family protein, partial [Alphaproteobacteria bacterium]